MAMPAGGQGGRVPHEAGGDTPFQGDGGPARRPALWVDNGGSHYLLRL
jgi:hypothetical protein